MNQNIPIQKVEIYTLDGRLFLEKMLSHSADEWKLSLAGFEAGLYCLKVWLTDETVLIKKIVKL